MNLRRLPVKLLYLAYYRFLFDRQFPGAEALARRVGRFERQTGRGDAPATKEVWDEQYAAGRWSFLEDTEELARFGVITGLVSRRGPEISVLDVGCGTGLLAELLRPHGYARYVGVDISERALAEAQSRRDENTTFVAADASVWESAEPFAAVVLNECLYYFDRPLEVFDRYRSLVAPGGILILSMFRSRRSEAIRRCLVARTPPRTEVELRHAKGVWRVSVFDAASSRSTAP